MSENETAAAEHFDAFRIAGDPSALFDALAAAQGDFPSLEKGKTVQVDGKEGKRGYTFEYADLAAIQKALRPMLKANGLSVIQPFFDCGKGFLIRTILAGHGSRIETDTFVERAGTIQQLGSALTYLKRYQYKAILGFEPDGEDDDGNAAEGNTATVTPKSAPRSQPTPPAPKPQQRSAPIKAAEPPERKSTPPVQTLPVDPQVQADIDRRKETNEGRAAGNAIRSAEGRPELLSDTSEAVPQRATSAATDDEPPATTPPSWETLADGHVPDDVSMRKGSATGAFMKELFVMRGFGFESSADIARTLGFIAEKTGGGNPQVKDLTYGQARSVIRALEAMS